MARPQVADAGTASDMGRSCEYIEQAFADSRQEWPSSVRVGRGANSSSLLKSILLRNIHRQNLAPGLILWYDLSNGKRARDLVLETLGACIGQVHLRQQPGNWLDIN